MYCIHYFVFVDVLDPLEIEIANVGTNSIDVAWGPVPGADLVYNVTAVTARDIPYEILVLQGKKNSDLLLTEVRHSLSMMEITAHATCVVLF